MSKVVNCLPSKMGLQAGAIFGRIKIEGSEFRDGHLRVFCDMSGFEFYFTLEPHCHGRSCLARTASFDVVLSPFSRQESVALTYALRDVINTIQKSDRGGLERFLPQESGNSKKRLIQLLEGLPASSSLPACVFRTQILHGLEDGTLSPNSIEASLSLREDYFRALANVTSKSPSLSGKRETALRWMSNCNISISSLDKAVQFWIQSPGNALHFGLACELGLARWKLYFMEDKKDADPDYNSLLKIVIQSSVRIENLYRRNGDRLAFVAIDVVGKDIASIKFYWNVPAPKAFKEFGRGRLWNFLASQSISLDGCPIIICERFHINGIFVDKSIHIGSPDVLGKLSSGYANWCGAAFERKWINSYVGRGLNFDYVVLSETENTERARHIYLSRISWAEKAGACLSE